MDRDAKLAARPLIAALLEHGSGRGYNSVEVDVLQGADTFIDLSGEEIARRLYMVENDGGERLALRPDFTIPVALDYLADGGNGQTRLAYSGSIFRKPKETQQVGFECLGAPQGPDVEVEVLKLALDGLARAGLTGTTLIIGDVGMLEAVLDAVPIRDDWRQLLKRAVGNPAKFTGLLAHFGDPAARYSGDPVRTEFLDRFEGLDEAGAIGVVEASLDELGLGDPIARDIPAIANRCRAMVADRSAEPLDGALAAALTTYLSLKAPADQIEAAIASFAGAHNLQLESALGRLVARNQALAAAGINLGAVTFDAGFGRALEYYTGFVFEIWPGPAGETGVLAGGGRYDALLTALGAEKPTTAAGCGLRIMDILKAGGRA